MANKRDLKKYIKYVCGDIAGECIFANLYFEGINHDKIAEVIVKAATLQTSMIDKVSVTFDKTPKSFDGNNFEYRKARKAYFKKCYKALKDEMEATINDIVTDMNSALTKEQKEANKEALSK